MKKILNWLLRPDLNLKSKWWHRLLLVIYIVALIGVIIFTISIFLDSNQIPKYKKIGDLSERMTDQPQLLKNIVNTNAGERVAKYEYNLYDFRYELDSLQLLNMPYYCSKDISSDIDGLSKNLSIDFYKSDTDRVSLNEFKEYLILMDANCVSVGTFSKYNPNMGKILTTEKTLFWCLEAEGLGIYKVSILQTSLNIALTLLYVFAFFIVILIAYYKIVLYVIFGSKK
jgi:hypothetical protein